MQDYKNDDFFHLELLVQCMKIHYLDLHTFWRAKLFICYISSITPKTPEFDTRPTLDHPLAFFLVRSLITSFQRAHFDADY
jgi:hypothetical protein